MPTKTTLMRLAFAASLLLMGIGLNADPSAPAPPAPVMRHTYLVDRLPHGTSVPPSWMNFGTAIPPCEMDFGYTNRGTTDEYGHLLPGQVYEQPQWTFTTAPAKPQRR